MVVSLYRQSVHLLVGLLLVLPVPVGSGDSIEARNTESVITSIVPSVPSGVRIDIVGFDTFVRVRAKGHVVTVPGYQQEPYVRIDSNGDVSFNTSSITYQLNMNRYGDVSHVGNTEGPPTWKLTSRDGTAMWHDHRAHWMSPKPPVPIDKEGTVQTWKIDVVVNDVPTVVDGVLYLRDQASMAWWFSGFFALLLALILAIAKRKLFFIFMVVISLASALIGAGEYLGLPNGARIAPLMMLFGIGSTVLASLAYMLYRRTETRHIAISLSAGAGTAMLICVWLSANQVRAAYVPGLEQMWLARIMIPTLLGVGVVATIDGVTRIVRNRLD